MSEPANGEHPSTAENATTTAPALTPPQRKPNRYTAKRCSLANRERIVNALANGDSQAAIARALHVSHNTISASR